MKMATELPKIKFKGGEYYFDERLKELRSVENPFIEVSLTNTDSDSIDYLIKNNVKTNWNRVLSDYADTIKEAKQRG